RTATPAPSWRPRSARSSTTTPAAARRWSGRWRRTSTPGAPCRGRPNACTSTSIPSTSGCTVWAGCWARTGRSPSGLWRSSWLSACTASAALTGEQVAGRASYARPEQHQDHDEDRASDNPDPLEPGGGQEVLELDDQGGPDDPAPERADAAEDDHHHDLAGGGPVEPVEGGEAVPDGEDAPGRPGQRGRQDEGEQPVALDGVAEGPRPRRVVPDGHQHPPERRADDPPGGEEPDQHERQPRVVEEERVGQVEAEQLA